MRIARVSASWYNCGNMKPVSHSAHVACAMLAAACLSCGAEPAWRPGPEWKDTPDPMASVMAKGVV